CPSRRTRAHFAAASKATGKQALLAREAAASSSMAAMRACPSSRASSAKAVTGSPLVMAGASPLLPRSVGGGGRRQCVADPLDVLGLHPEERNDAEQGDALRHLAHRDLVVEHGDARAVLPALPVP